MVISALSTSTVPVIGTAPIRRPQVEQRVVKALLSTPGIVSLVGLGGIGKTTLAAAAADALKERKWLVAWLHGTPDFEWDSALRDVVRNLERADLAALQQASLAREAMNLVKATRVAVVLDNADEVLPEELDRLVGVLCEGGGASILTTARSHLTLPGTVSRITVDLSGFEVPEARLLVERAAAARQVLALSDLHEHVLARLYALTGGHPQALLWFVDQARHTPPLQLLTELEQRRHEPPLHDLLEAQINGLGVAALRLLETASLLDGPTTLEPLAAAAELDVLAAADALHEAQWCTLLQVQTSAVLVELHPLVRAAVRARLQVDSPAGGSRWEWVIQTYTRLAQLHRAVRTADDHAWFDAHLAVLLGLARVCRSRKAWAELLALLRPLNTYFWKRGFWRERMTWAEVARVAAESLGDRWAEGEILSRDIGWSYLQIGEVDRAWDAFVTAEPLLLARRHFSEVCNVRRYLSQIARIRSNLQVAHEYLKAALSAAECLRDTSARDRAIARLRLDWGHQLRAEGDLTAAEQEFSVAGEFFQQAGDHQRRAYALAGLASVHEAAGDYAAAERHLEEYLATAATIGSRVDQARAKLALSRICLTKGANLQVQNHAEQARSVFREAALPIEAAEAERVYTQAQQAGAWLKVDHDARRILVNGDVVIVAPMEFDLLSLLVRMTGTVCTFEHMQSELWPGSRVTLLDVRRNVQPLISRLRDAIPQLASRTTLRSVRGEGYVFTGELDSEGS